ncbi:hypothetical protein R3W88_033810 [Solanum pinnatisectum]|uniref:DUF4216 domain-containing protein n=1 Tax=Solanum pinnatisectum TaxID=50273 RepID=A0AAV9K207_9SOLN|nr:hypothetical protein R3W88_033810 [Solanum pinnatisectum]
MAESTKVFSHYFEPHGLSRHHNMSRNDDGGVMENAAENLSIFTHPTRLSGKAKKRDFMYVQRLQEEFRNLSQNLIDESHKTYFFVWFKEYVRPNHIENEYLRSLFYGPLISVYAYPICFFFNGYTFHIVDRGSARLTMNSRVCISDQNTGGYYGRIREIIQVEYRTTPSKQEHNRYKLIDVNHRRQFKKYESFILATQATQVCYMSYSSTKKDKDDWLAVFKVKPRDVIELLDEGVITIPESNIPFQVEEI